MKGPTSSGENGNKAGTHWLTDMVLGVEMAGNPIMHPRRFARVRPSGKVSGAAKIIVDPKVSPVDCTVVDYSAGGACLQLIAGTLLPPRFELLHGRARKRCRIVWRDRQRVGVAF
jgi:hypothetical protein